MKDDEDWMRDALLLAQKGLGLTAPNPAVGAIVVKDGVMVGSGWHQKAGTAHAEVHALADAGEQARGATAYVTLEPCSTYGRTPPCCAALIKAGVTRVVVGCEDPNPDHAGRGYDLLRQAGIEVVAPVLEEECQQVIRGFAFSQVRKRAYLSLKLAASLDGRIADWEGASRWISGEASRDRVQCLRREVDAILVGRRTAELDNPSLLPRPAEGRNPRRVILDRKGSLPLSLRVFRDEQCGRSICVLGERASETRVDALSKLGVQVLRCPEEDGHLDLALLLEQLRKEGLNHVLCEGGGEVAASLMKQNLVDELFWVLAPKVLGAQGTAVLAGGWRLPEAPAFELTRQERVGEDLWLTLSRNRSCEHAVR